MGGKRFATGGPVRITKDLRKGQTGTLVVFKNPDGQRQYNIVLSDKSELKNLPRTSFERLHVAGKNSSSNATILRKEKEPQIDLNDVVNNDDDECEVEEEAEESWKSLKRSLHKLFGRQCQRLLKTLRILHYHRILPPSKSLMERLLWIISGCFSLLNRSIGGLFSPTDTSRQEREWPTNRRSSSEETKRNTQNLSLLPPTNQLLLQLMLQNLRRTESDSYCCSSWS